jgi:ubiquinone/menaquinone biosynthesis C-methylase UbiE
MTYLKQVFDPQTLEHAKNVVLTPDPARPAKFDEETEFLIEFINRLGIIVPNSLVLDFGCGMGRVARKLVETFGCRVVGTDISEKMLEFARRYAKSEKFTALPSYNGSDIDVAIVAFVLQHTEDPKKEIENLYHNLKPGGHVVLLDDGKRFVPSGVDKQGFVIWSDDKVGVEEIMSRYFSKLGSYPYINRAEQILSVWKKD